MHPGFHGWWRARARDCRDAALQYHAEHHHHGDHHEHHGGPRGWHGRHGGPFGAWASPGFDEGGVLGVRRPLRFLAYKLDLSEEQVAAFAAILDDLKTERAQAAVDQRRRISALAEAIEGSAFDASRVAAAGDEQQRSDERVRAAVAAALGKMHAALDTEQRKKLAYLLRTGALSM